MWNGDPVKKPDQPGDAVVDWCHPLARGLAFYGLCVAGGAVELARGRTLLTEFPGRREQRVTALGVSFAETDQQGGYHALGLSDLPLSAGASLFVQLRHMGERDYNVATATALSLQFHQMAAEIRHGYNDARLIGTIRASDTDVGVTLLNEPDRPIGIAGVTYDRARVAGYWQGREVDAVACGDLGPMDQGLPDRADRMYVGRTRAGEYAYRADIFWTGLWTVPLAPNEIAWLAVEPYAFLRPARDVRRRARPRPSGVAGTLTVDLRPPRPSMTAGASHQAVVGSELETGVTGGGELSALGSLGGRVVASPAVAAEVTAYARIDAELLASTQPARADGRATLAGDIALPLVAPQLQGVAEQTDANAEIAGRLALVVPRQFARGRARAVLLATLPLAGPRSISATVLPPLSVIAASGEPAIVRANGEQGWIEAPAAPPAIRAMGETR